MNILHSITPYETYIQKLIKANKGVSVFFFFFFSLSQDVERSWLTISNQALHTRHSQSAQRVGGSPEEQKKKKAGLLLVSFEQS